MHLVCLKVDAQGRAHCPGWRSAPQEATAEMLVGRLVTSYSHGDDQRCWFPNIDIIAWRLRRKKCPQDQLVISGYLFDARVEVFGCRDHELRIVGP
jgi:hypothetical protein